MEITGYSPVVLYLILIIGMPLALLKPYKGFLASVFLILAAPADQLTHTRFAAFGPYFNANDACILVACTAFFSYAVLMRNGFKFPLAAKWILAVLLIGFVESILILRGYEYEVTRALRWAISLPVYMILAASFVNTREKVRSLLIVLFFASIASAIGHLSFVHSRMELFTRREDYAEIRTLAFRSFGLYLLLAALIWMPKIKGLRRSLAISAGALFAVSVILNQTRSIWISSIVALPIAFWFFPQKNILRKAILLPMALLLILASTSLFFNRFTPGVSQREIVMQRTERLFGREAERYDQTMSRQLDFERETDAWLGGTLLLGRGLYYYAEDVDTAIGGYDIAWGHLGHLSTLAQLGLIGFFVYSIYLPLSILRDSRLIWNSRTIGEVKYLGLLAGVCAIWLWICFFMSDSYLAQHPIEGLVFGAAWRQASMLRYGTVEEPVENTFSRETAECTQG